MNTITDTNLGGLARGLLAAAVIAALPAVSNAATGTFFKFNNPGDPNFNQLLGINDSSIVVGYFGDGTVVANNGYLFVPRTHYSVENFTKLPAGDHASQTQAIGISNDVIPKIVGFYQDNATGFIHGFVDNNGVQATVDDPSGLPPHVTTPTQNLLGINGVGTAAGFWVDNAGHEHGFMVKIGTSNVFTEIPPSTFTGAVATQASNITDKSDVCGFWTDASGNNHGFYGTIGAFKAIDVVIGGVAAASTSPFGCNNSGEVVGAFIDGSGNTHGFIYSGGTYTQYDAPGSSQTAAFGVAGTFINGINDSGDYTGFYSDGKHVNGFVWYAP